MLLFPKTNFCVYKKYNKDGYVVIRRPNHPNATNYGWVLQHRLVVENKIGRYLLPNEIIHHVNEKRSDNRINNLIIVSKKQHSIIHSKFNYNDVIDEGVTMDELFKYPDCP